MRFRDHATTLGCALAIVAKMPRTGACKTRLVPAFAPDDAAALSFCFIADTMRNIATATTRARAHAVALYSPAASETELRDVFGSDCTFVAQRGDDFGERLSHGVDDILALGYTSVCLIDSDSPTLPTGYLERVVLALERPGDCVALGPAIDGGYYALGLKRRHPQLFDGIAWSTARVCTQTFERAQALGIEVESLPVWYDVDDAGAFALLEREFRTGLPAGGFAAPVTRAYVAMRAARREMTCERS